MSNDKEQLSVNNQDLQFEEISMEEINKTVEMDFLKKNLVSDLNEQAAVANLSETKDVTVRKTRSVSKTKKEFRSIAEQLKSETVHFGDETKAKLEVRQGRNLSHLLVNSTKLTGDSSEMKDVKKAIMELEEELSRQRDSRAAISAEEMDLIENRYTAAIQYCQHYLAVKTTHTGSARYEMVLAKLNQLTEEMGYFETMKTLVGHAEFEDYLKADSVAALLIAARVLKESKRNLRVEKVAVIYEDEEPATEEITEEEINAEKMATELKDKAAVFSAEELKEMDSVTANIVKLLTLMDKPQNIVSSKDSDEAGLVMYFLNMLRKYPEGAHAEFFNAATVAYKGSGYKRTVKDKDGKKAVPKTLVGLIQNAQGQLFIKVNDVTREIPYSKDAILGNMTTNILDSEKKFGTENVDSAVSWIKDDAGAHGLVTVRNACLKLINNRMGIKPTEFNNFPTDIVREIAIGVMNSQYDKKELAEMVDIIDGVSESTKRRVNGEETLELLALRENMLARLHDKVVMQRPTNAVVLHEDTKEVQWTPLEVEAKLLIADMVYSKDTWEADENIYQPGIRMQKAISEHSYAFFQLMKDNKLAISMVQKMPLPAESKMEILKSFAKMREVAMQDKELATMILGVFDRPIIEAAVNVFIQCDEAVEAFAAFEYEIDQIVEDNAVELQEQITGAVEELFSEKEEKPDELAQMLGDMEDLTFYMDKTGFNPELMQDVVERGNAVLSKTIRDAAKGSTGQGLFMRNVLKNYFVNVSTLDKRSIFASIIRDAKANGVDITEDMPKEQRNAIAGNYIGSVFKGAGPLLQKMLQGMPLEGVPKELMGAFDAVKSNLLPIPQEIVEAQLLAMVERSNGAVTRIEVTKSLGAASVGQAFLCKLYGPSMDKEGKEVVIKLLRPDVRNRMLREKPIMLKWAAETNEGMRKTYEGQLERIEEELDLTIEARNVERGQIYNKSRNPKTETDSVSAMKLNSLIAPTTNSMVIEKSPGTTVDKYLGGIDDQLVELLKPCLVLDEKGSPQYNEDGGLKMQFTRDNILEMRGVKQKMCDVLETAKKRQKHLIILAEKWIEEGLFGEGFYHGDLHSGNIMIDDDTATIIDFGNATQLDDMQKEQVTRMMSAAYVGDTELFCDSYRKLMRQDEATQAFFSHEFDKFHAMIKQTLMYGDGSSSGQRIGVALIKAQELGLELPASIFNFSQCQLRLQNTIDDMNKKIHDIEEALRNLDKQLQVNPKTDKDIPLAILKDATKEPDSGSAMIYFIKKTVVFVKKDEFIRLLDDDSDMSKDFLEKCAWAEHRNSNMYTDLKGFVDEFRKNKPKNLDNYLNEIRFHSLAKYCKAPNLDFLKLLTDIYNFKGENEDAAIEAMLAPYKERFDFQTQLDAFEELKERYKADNGQDEELKSEYEAARVDLYTLWSNTKKYDSSVFADTGFGNRCVGTTSVACGTQNMLSNIRTADEEINALVEPYLNHPKYGEELRKRYQVVMQWRDILRNTTDPKLKTENGKKLRAVTDDYCSVFYIVLMDKLDEMKQQGLVEDGERITTMYEEDSIQKDFMNVMGNVLSDNVGKMIKRLGMWGVKHRKAFE